LWSTSSDAMRVTLRCSARHAPTPWATTEYTRAELRETEYCVHLVSSTRSIPVIRSRSSCSTCAICILNQIYSSHTKPVVLFDLFSSHPQPDLFQWCTGVHRRVRGAAVGEGQTPTAVGPPAAERKITPAAGRPRSCDTNPRAFFPISSFIAFARKL
jgi:hypothetical protein